MDAILKKLAENTARLADLVKLEQFGTIKISPQKKFNIFACAFKFATSSNPCMHRQQL
jgi:hypothetical protein